MKILITGAHFTPAQAVIEQLRKDPEIEIVYVGRKTTMEGDKTESVESRVLPKLGIRFINLTAGRLSRIPSLNSLISILKIPIGFVQGFWIVFKESPDLTLSFGGYVSVPVVVSSFLLSVPVITHEQTLVLGLANQINSLFADRVAVSFDKDLGLNPEKVVLTGNPLRTELTDQTVEPGTEVRKFLAGNGNLPLVYITGGNQGSREINEKVKAILPGMLEFCAVIHQTGDSKYQDFETLSGYKKTLKRADRYLVQKWYDAPDVTHILKKTDLAVCRAGLNTLYELAYFQVPAIVIPLPYLYKNEQLVNAQYFQKLGLSETLNQQTLTPDKLLQKIKQMVKDIQSYKKSAAGAKSVVKLEASQKLAIEVLTLAGNNR